MKVQEAGFHNLTVFNDKGSIMTFSRTLEESRHSLLERFNLGLKSSDNRVFDKSIARPGWIGKQNIAVIEIQEHDLTFKSGRIRGPLRDSSHEGISPVKQLRPTKRIIGPIASICSSEEITRGANRRVRNGGGVGGYEIAVLRHESSYPTICICKRCKKTVKLLDTW